MSLLLDLLARRAHFRGCICIARPSRDAVSATRRKSGPPRGRAGDPEFDHDRLEAMSIVEVASYYLHMSGYASGALSPATLVRASLARIRSYNPLLHAVTKTLPEFDAAMQARDSAVRWWSGRQILLARPDCKSNSTNIQIPVPASKGASLDGIPSNGASLDGIPLAVKDNFSTMNMPTTCASAMLRDYKGSFDAAVVEFLEEAGAVIVGKTNMDEFAMGSMNIHSIYGPCINPVNSHPPHSMTEAGSTYAKRVAGGSSGGSAAAVAVGMAIAALGSDTGGSVRLPASYCGVYGFKPSYGRISRYGLVTYAHSLDTVGILSKSVVDARIVFEALDRYDERDPTASWVLHKLHKPRRLEAAKDESRPLAGLRIGIPKEYRVAELSGTMLRRWSRAAQILENLGAECVAVSLEHTRLALPAYYVLAPAEASSNLARFDGVRYGHRADEKPERFEEGGMGGGELFAETRAEGFGEEVKRRIMLGTFVLREDTYNSYYLQAQKYRRLVMDDFNSVFRSAHPVFDVPGNPDGVDLLLTPAAVGTAPLLEDARANRDPVSEYVNDVMTIPASLAGLPALVFPFGSSREDGFPIGLQLVGQYGDDEFLLDAATVFERGVKGGTWK